MRALRQRRSLKGNNSKQSLKDKIKTLWPSLLSPRLCFYGRRKAAGCLILFYAFDVSNFDLLSHLHAFYVSFLHLLAKS